jgi:hypothetical protein
MDEKEKIKHLETKLLEYARKLGAVQGTLAVVIDLDRPVFINNKLKELDELIKD